jgi:hypothetical protein
MSQHPVTSKHPDLLFQHPRKHTCNILMKCPKHMEHTIATCTKILPHAMNVSSPPRLLAFHEPSHHCSTSRESHAVAGAARHLGLRRGSHAPDRAAAGAPHAATGVVRRRELRGSRELCAQTPLRAPWELPLGEMARDADGPACGRDEEK